MQLRLLFCEASFVPQAGGQTCGYTRTSTISPKQVRSKRSPTSTGIHSSIVPYSMWKVMQMSGGRTMGSLIFARNMGSSGSSPASHRCPRGPFASDGHACTSTLYRRPTCHLAYTSLKVNGRLLCRQHKGSQKSAGRPEGWHRYQGDDHLLKHDWRAEGIKDL